MEEVVWLDMFRRFGFLNVRNATNSLVTYQVEGGTWVHDWIENDEYEFWSDRNTDYESE